MALIIDNASRLGKKNSMANVLGLCSATYLHGALSILGVSAILLNNKSLFLAVKLLGATYLLYMGIKSIISGMKNIKVKQKMNASVHFKAKPVEFSKSYIDGFITQILNPKVSIFYIAAFPNFIASENNIKRGFELVTIHSMNIFLWFTFLTIFISFTSAALKKPHIKGWLNISTGFVLTLFAVFIFYE
ncbi:LysE family translocator [Fluviispira vulneris]|uniref:LysE family translocator n=1 Tax=Fluviispira vulneris TaxID=2763012 RepID=UPI001C93CBF4